MDFIDEVRTRSGRFQKRVDKMADSEFVEEATKTSFVLPFIQMLGYDIFDPLEVVPEFTADVGTKKGEKVDFALMQEGVPVLLIEVKKAGAGLTADHISQLLRYFGVTDARVGILTDGLTYLFFSDLDQQNVMDPRPFFEFNMLDFTDLQVKELRRFTKEQFDKESIVDAARELKYTAQIKRLLAEELSEPSDKFVKFVIGQVYEGRISSAVRKMFSDLTSAAFKQFVNDKINDRLASALQQESNNASDLGDDEEQPDEPETEFEQSDLDVLGIVKAILAGIVDVECLALRRTQRYIAVVLHKTPGKQDYGDTVFRFRIRADNVWLERPGTPVFNLVSVGDIYTLTDFLRTEIGGGQAVRAQEHEKPKEIESE